MFDPLQYEFFVRGLIVATLVGALCGLIGVYIVLRRMAYIGHGLSHAVFGGAVGSYVIDLNFFIADKSDKNSNPQLRRSAVREHSRR